MSEDPQTAAPKGGSALSDEQLAQIVPLLSGPQTITDMATYHQMLGAQLMEAMALKAHIAALHTFVAQLVPMPAAEPDPPADELPAEDAPKRRKRAPLSIIEGVAVDPAADG